MFCTWIGRWDVNPGLCHRLSETGLFLCCWQAFSSLRFWHAFVVLPAMFYRGDGSEKVGVETIQADVDDNRRLPFAGLKQALQDGEEDVS